jgi:hypothetical protein
MRRAEGTPRFRRPIESDPRRAGRVDGSPRAYRIEDELDTYRGEPQQPAQPDGYTPTCPCDLCVEYRRLCGVYREYQESQARQRSYVEQMSAYTMSEGDVYNTFGVDPGIVRGARGDVVINDSSEGWNLSWVDPVATRRTITLRPNEDGSSVTWNDDSSITVEYQGQVMRFTNDVETTIHPDGRIVISYRA